MRKIFIKSCVAIASVTLANGIAFGLDDDSRVIFTAADGTKIDKRVVDGKATTTVTTSSGAVRTIVRTKNKNGDNKVILKTHSGKINDPIQKIEISSTDKPVQKTYQLAQNKKVEKN